MHCDRREEPKLEPEDLTFMHMFVPSQGVCPANSVPIYRVYNGRPDTNHRHVNDMATRNQMEARGWMPEGDGPDRVTMCAPQ